MRKAFKKVLLSLGISLMLISCGTVKKQQETNHQLGLSMKISCDIENGKQYQVDSLMVSDTLPSINKWLRNTYVDYETGERYIKRMYIRTYSDGTEAVYIIIGQEEPYKRITKRITQN